MIIIDRLLQQREDENNPIRVGMVGAGFIGRGIAMQLIQVVPGIELSVIANRHLSGAKLAFTQAGIQTYHQVNTVSQLNHNIRNNILSITEDAKILCQSNALDVIIDVTGNIQFGAEIALESFAYGKHFLTMSAELDGTIGPLLKYNADKAGVIYSLMDGDQPGVTMNLYRFVKGIGIRPLLAGNIKGLHDPYRNPTTQKEFAEKWKQKPHMVTSFADGTKISFEQAVIANATDMRVAKRGMYGFKVPAGTPLEEAMHEFPLADLENSGNGIVDYLVGASPGPGVFILGTIDNPIQKEYLELYKLGKGPFYCFYRPYHLCHFEAHNSIARAVLFNDPTLSPEGPLKVGVITTAKTDLKAGTILDGLGHYHTYGLTENMDVIKHEDLLPIGIAKGCKLINDIQKNAPITMADVILPEGRIIDQLILEQNNIH